MGTEARQGVRHFHAGEALVPPADGGQLLGRGRLLARINDARLNLLLQPGDAHHEQLVEVAAHDSEET